ncbi:MAG: signal peptidase I [Sphingomonadales bacterium]|nr:signal peptidase I [Sphingomonadales bacterium]
MMDEAVNLAVEGEARGSAARLGITLLNLLLPGLGLFRLSRYRAGGVFFVGTILVLLAVVTYLAAGPEPTFSSFVIVAGAGLAAMLFFHASSMILTWKWSAKQSNHARMPARWYALAAVFVIYQMVVWPVPDIVKSRFRCFVATSVSMAPTLEHGDRFAARMGTSVSLKRGDLVIVGARGEEFVRRIAALPDDHVAMRRGVLILNRNPIPQRIDGSIQRANQYDTGSYDIIRETFPGETGYHLTLDQTKTELDDFPEIVLQNGQYFVLGDNRDHSADSRIDPQSGGLGVIERAQIKGRVLFRYWRAGRGLSGEKL